MAFLAHKQRAATALTGKRSQQYPYLIPAKAGIQGLQPNGQVLRVTSGPNSTPVGTNADGTRMYWTEINESSLFSNQSTDSGWPYSNPTALFSGTINVPAWNAGSFRSFRDTHIAHNGALLATGTSVNDEYGYMYRAPDAETANFGANPVLHLGATTANGIATVQAEQQVGFRSLGTMCFANGVLNGGGFNNDPCTLYIEYAPSAADVTTDRRVWYTIDDGVTWAVFWQSSSTSRHRRHGHGIFFDPDGNVVMAWGDTDAETAIIKGPPDPDEWVAIANQPNAIISVTADPAKFGIAWNSQNARAIGMVWKNGFAYYGSDGNPPLTGVYRLKQDFGLGAVPARVYTGEGGRMLAEGVRSAGAYVTSSGQIIISDWLEGGTTNPSSSLELRINGSVDGNNWADIGRILLDPAKVNLGGNQAFFNCTNILELDTGHIVFGQANYRRDLRDTPSGSVTPPEVAIATLGGPATTTVLAPEQEQ